MARQAHDPTSARSRFPLRSRSRSRFSPWLLPLAMWLAAALVLLPACGPAGPTDGSGAPTKPPTPTPVVTVPASTPTSVASPTEGSTPAPSPTPANSPTEPPPTPTPAPTIDPVVELADVLGLLSRSDPESGGEAIEALARLAGPVGDEAVRDALFSAYVAFLQDLVFTLMENFDDLNTAWQADPQGFQQDMATEGIRLVSVDGSFLLVPDLAIAGAILDAVLTPRAREYCRLMDARYDLEPMAGEGGLFVSIEDLDGLIAGWAAFVDALPAGTDFPLVPAETKYRGHFDARTLLARFQSLRTQAEPG